MEFSAISEVQKPEPSIMGLKIILIFALSRRGKKKANPLRTGASSERSLLLLGTEIYLNFVY